MHYNVDELAYRTLVLSAYVHNCQSTILLSSICFQDYRAANNLEGNQAKWEIENGLLALLSQKLTCRLASNHDGFEHFGFLK